MKSIEGRTWRAWRELASRGQNQVNNEVLLKGLQHLSNIIQRRDINGALPGDVQISQLRGSYAGAIRELLSHNGANAHLQMYLFDKQDREIEQLIGKPFSVQVGGSIDSHSFCIDRVLAKRAGAGILVSAVYAILAEDLKIPTATTSKLNQEFHQIDTPLSTSDVLGQVAANASAYITTPTQYAQLLAFLFALWPEKVELLRELGVTLLEAGEKECAIRVLGSYTQATPSDVATAQLLTKVKQD